MIYHRFEHKRFPLSDISACCVCLFCVFKIVTARVQSIEESQTGLSYMPLSLQPFLLGCLWPDSVCGFPYCQFFLLALVSLKRGYVASGTFILLLSRVSIL